MNKVKNNRDRQQALTSDLCLYVHGQMHLHIHKYHTQTHTNAQET